MDANTLTTILLALIGGTFLTGVAAVVTAIFSGKGIASKNELSALTEASLSLKTVIDTLQSENARMSERLKELIKEEEIIEHEYRVLQDKFEVMRREDIILKERVETLINENKILKERIETLIIENKALHARLSKEGE